MTHPDNVQLRTSGVVAGVPVFTGTRVPLQTLVPYLTADQGIEAFLDDHPEVTREQVYNTLCRSVEALIEHRQRIVELAAQGRLDNVRGGEAPRANG